MKELQKNVINEFGKFNEGLIDAIKDAEKNNAGLDLTDIWKVYNEVMVALNDHFHAAEERSRNKGKKGWGK